MKHVQAALPVRKLCGPSAVHEEINIVPDCYKTLIFDVGTAKHNFCKKKNFRYTSILNCYYSTIYILNIHISRKQLCTVIFGKKCHNLGGGSF